MKNLLIRGVSRTPCACGLRGYYKSLLNDWCCVNAVVKICSRNMANHWVKLRGRSCEKIAVWITDISLEIWECCCHGRNMEKLLTFIENIWVPSCSGLHMRPICSLSEILEHFFCPCFCSNLQQQSMACPWRSARLRSKYQCGAAGMYCMQGSLEKDVSQQYCEQTFCYSLFWTELCRKKTFRRRLSGARRKQIQCGCHILVDLLANIRESPGHLIQFQKRRSDSQKRRIRSDAASKQRYDYPWKTI